MHKAAAERLKPSLLYSDWNRKLACVQHSRARFTFSAHKKKILEFQELKDRSENWKLQFIEKKKYKKHNKRTKSSYAQKNDIKQKTQTIKRQKNGKNYFSLNISKSVLLIMNSVARLSGVA